MEQFVKHATFSKLSQGGMTGRLATYKARTNTKRVIYMISGMHTSHERMSPIAHYFSKYGTVIAPDLPGVGGMDSFFTVNQEFSLNSYADFLYDFFKQQKIKSTNKPTIVGMSFGFLVLTRMLQRHPDTHDWFEQVVAIGGFGQQSDFNNKLAVKITPVISLPLSTRPGAWFLETFIFKKPVLKVLFKIAKLIGNTKHNSVSNEDRKALIDMETSLWVENDARTRFHIYRMFLNTNLVKGAQPIGNHLYNLFIPSDQWVKHDEVQKSMKRLYKKVTKLQLDSTLHAPSVISGEEEIDTMFKEALTKVFR